MIKKPQRFKAGWCEADGRKFYVKSSWEKSYLFYLAWLKKNKQIEEFSYESRTFWFEGIKRGVCSYKPDFCIHERNGTETYVELKGYFDARSKTKIKRMKKYWPEIKLVVIDAKAWKKLLPQIRNLK